MTQDEQYMHRCLQLAKNGRQNAQPNPMVGAVIVHNGRIVGEGYHVRCGEGHAEVNAFASVKAEDEKLLHDSTIYVSLEPCSHYGKTPPCADLIIRKGIKRVVVGCQDPFAKVQGRGIQKIRDAGIIVDVGICEEECKKLNKVFFTYHQYGRPYITLKWAQSSDGFIGAFDAHGNRKQAAISDQYTRMHAHKLRAQSQAILVGKNTYYCDHPSLTTRYWYGPDPKRIILTHDKNIMGKDRISIMDNNTIVTGGNIYDIMSELHDDGIQSLLVEGGRNVLQEFIDARLWDEAYMEQGPHPIGQGTVAPILPSDVSVDKEFITWFGRLIIHYTNLKINRGKDNKL